MNCKKEESLRGCICTWPDCSRKGICCNYLKYHWQKRELPVCFFSKEAEKTFDRSIENFIRDQKNK